MFSAWEMNVSLADELKALRSRIGTEAADERAKIVAWLQDYELAEAIEAGAHLEEGEDEYGCEYCEGGGKLDHNDCCPQCGALFLDEDDIEAGEHLK